MLTNLPNSTLNILLIRFFTLSIRFLFIVFFSKAYSLDIVGIYGLIYAISALISQIVPFELHNFITLEVLNNKDKFRRKIISNSLLFVFASFILSVPLFFLLFNYTNIGESYFLYVIILCFLETFSREFERLFIGLSKPTSKYISVFLKSFPWMFTVLILISINRIIDFETVLILWILSTFLSVIYGFFTMRKYIYFLFNFNKFLSVSFIKKGLIFSFPFLIATVCHTCSQYLGRFILSYELSNEIVGIFSIYFQISALLLILSDISYSIYLPKYAQNYKLKLLKKNKTFEYFNLLILIIFGILIYYLSPFLFSYINVELLKYLVAFYVMISAMIILSFSGILRMRLYIRRLNYEIMFSNLFFMIASLICNSLLIKAYGLNGAALSLLIPSIILCTSILLFSNYHSARELNEK
jgi:O-antigen/teichoic acid export membrane protein